MFIFKLARLIMVPIAAAALLGDAQPAHAILTYYIYESGSDVIVETSGDLRVANSQGRTNCGANGAIRSNTARICTGPDRNSERYTMQGPANFGTGTLNFGNSVSGPVSTNLDGVSGIFLLQVGYVSGDPIVGSAVFSNRTLSGLGINSTGLLGTWTLNSTGDTIEVRTGAPPADAPGPLPLFGAAAAFAYSRRLRLRVSLSRVELSSAASISA